MAKSALLPIERCGAKARGVGCIRAVVARIVIWPHQCRHLPVVPLCRRCIPQAGLSANKVAPCFFDAESGAASGANRSGFAAWSAESGAAFAGVGSEKWQALSKCVSEFAIARRGEKMQRKTSKELSGSLLAAALFTDKLCYKRINRSFI